MADRTSTWEQDFNSFLAQAATGNFGPKLPCAFFATDAVRSVIGEDVSPELRTRAGLARCYRAHQADGEAFLVRAMDEKFERRPLAFAQRGDVICHDGALGVCIGAEAVFLAAGDAPGFVRLPVLECGKAWAVG